MESLLIQTVYACKKNVILEKVRIQNKIGRPTQSLKTSPR